jgi:hypothetical protein
VLTVGWTKIEQEKLQILNPDDLLRVWNTQLRNYRECKRKWFYQDILGLEKKQPTRPIFFGEVGHFCMESLYLKGTCDVNDAYDDTCSRYPSIELFDEEIKDIKSSMQRIIDDYVMYYSDSESKWIKTILGAEVEWKVDLIPDAVQVEGVADIVLEDHRDNVHIMDHKFTASPFDVDHYVRDTQISTYFWGVGEKLERDITSFMINAILNKKPPKTSKYGEPRFNREAFYRSQMHKDSYLTEVVCQCVQMLRDRNLWITKGNSIHIYRTVSKDCKYCWMRPLCDAERIGGDPDAVIEMEYQRRKVRPGRG